MSDWQISSDRDLVRSAMGEAVTKGLEVAESQGVTQTRTFVMTWEEWHGLMAEVQKGLVAEAYDEFLFIVNGLPVGVIRDCFTKFTAEAIRRTARPTHG